MYAASITEAVKVQEKTPLQNAKVSFQKSLLWAHKNEKV